MLSTYMANCHIRFGDLESDEEASCKSRAMHRAHEGIMPNITWRDEKSAKWTRKQTYASDILEDINKLKMELGMVCDHSARQ